MRVLIVEDESPKLAHLEAFIRERYNPEALVSARSVKGSMGALGSRPFDLVVLDMSLPTFDIASGERGGRPQGFGGRELLRELERLELYPAVVVVTQYPVFSEEGRDISLEELSAELALEFPDTFAGVVYFNNLVGGWKEALQNILSQLADSGKL